MRSSVVQRGGPQAGAASLDLVALDEFLRASLPGLQGRMRVEKIGGGQSNPTFFVSFDDRRLVLRKKPAATCCRPRKPSTASSAS